MPCLSSSAVSVLKDSIRASNAASQLALPLAIRTFFGSSVIGSPKGSAVWTSAAGGCPGVPLAAGAGAALGAGLAEAAGAGVAGGAGLAAGPAEGAGLEGKGLEGKGLAETAGAGVDWANAASKLKMRAAAGSSAASATRKEQTVIWSSPGPRQRTWAGCPANVAKYRFLTCERGFRPMTHRSFDGCLGFDFRNPGYRESPLRMVRIWNRDTGGLAK